jgi:hypothetical protein
MGGFQEGESSRVSMTSADDRRVKALTEEPAAPSMRASELPLARSQPDAKV